MNETNAITFVEEEEAPARSVGGLIPVAAIEAQIARAEKMGEALDKLRALAIKRTVPGDWVFHGDQGYLEGDGALRLAPMIGLRLHNVRKLREVADDGHVRVTTTLDASSALFGTEFAGISRTRSTADQFLRQGREKADLEDVEAASYKGAVARAVQIIAGLSGLSRTDLKDRFGLDLSGAGSVAFKGGQSEAKKADAVQAGGAIAEIHALLLSVFEGNPMAAADWLEKTTENKEKGWQGKRDANRLTEAGAKFVLAKLRALSLEKGREPGAEG